ncbi:MAG: hypothetical protein MK226_06375 [Saprospiraceae bacterium]|nr:hypothetical protein [Saprospiraceae bacterium]
MKKIIYFTICILFFACNETIEASGPTYQAILASYEVEDILENIQQKVNDAFTRAIIEKSPVALQNLDSALQNVEEGQAKKLANYWRAYLHFYITIYHLQEKDKKEAEYYCDAAIEILEDMDDKNVEDYALLAMIRGISISFKAGIRAPFISGKAEKEVKKAMALDENNLRAWYVIANNDYYKPEQYGGGKKVESHLLKAIELPDQKVPNNYLPSWGKSEAYELLIKFYIKKERWKDAKAKFAEANKAYPNNFQINKLASKLIDK